MNIGKARVHDPQKSYALEDDVSSSARITYINLWKLWRHRLTTWGQRKSSNRLVSKLGLVPAFKAYGSERSNCCESEREGVTYGL